MKNETSALPPKLQPLTSLLDSQPPEVQEALQFLLATAMHEGGKFGLLNQVPPKRKATCINRTGGFSYCHRRCESRRQRGAFPPDVPQPLHLLL
jgi:hypothetical protein